MQGFFKLRSPRPGRPRPPVRRPTWLGPLEDSFGVLVPLHLVLVRTADLAVAIPSATAYRTGFDFALAVLTLGRLDAMTDPAPARRVGHQPTLLQLRVWVHYHQVYLLEASSDLSGMLDDGLASPVGIICVRPGSAFLTTGLHTGVVGFTVAVADRDPGADLDTYEDVVEISYDSPTGIVWLEEWGGEGSHTLPPLAGGPGWHRLRYHARGMDAAQQADTSEEPIDEYLLQIWPEPHKEPAVVKLTSDTAQYWIDHSAQA